MDGRAAECAERFFIAFLLMIVDTMVMKSSIDRPTDVRPGESLDVERLGPVLRDALDVDGEVEVLQYPSGWSNLTYMLRIGDTDVVLRRPPFGSKPKTGHDMKREHDVLAALYGTYPYCPRPLLYCDDEAIVGSPFYVMERIEGVIVRRDFPPELCLSPADIGAVFNRVIDAQAELHAIDVGAVGLEDFGKPEGYVERQIKGWNRRYRRARTPDVPDCEDVMAWLEDNQPADSGHDCLIHNDFRLDNVVLDPADPKRIVGVLDWEMATLGDPLMDLGASLAYWVEQSDPPAFQAIRMMPANADGAPTRSEVVARYRSKSGLEIGDFGFYYCYGLFRLAGIVQQIYFRAYHGQTGDPRFKELNLKVSLLAEAAENVIDNR
jgi:aminoglycoside phosphotransferase (APT) family kinase protein